MSELPDWSLCKREGTWEVVTEKERSYKGHSNAPRKETLESVYKLLGKILINIADNTIMGSFIMIWMIYYFAKMRNLNFKRKK